MVKTEKYKDSIMAIAHFCSHINREIGAYQSHYLSEDYHFTVDVGNGFLKIPLHLAADFNKETTAHTTDLILAAASSFKAKETAHRTYKKILADWRKLFSDKRRK